MLQHLDPCEDVVDVFDDTRIGIWEAITRYEIGYYKNDRDLMNGAVIQLKQTIDRMLTLAGHAKEKLSEHPNKELIVKVLDAFVRNTKTEIEEIITLMESRTDPETILETQLDHFEYFQFKRQHEILLLCKGCIGITPFILSELSSQYKE